MIIQKLYPSAYYPEYFRSDIQLGSKRELPFASGLDQLLHRFMLLRLKHLTPYLDADLAVSDSVSPQIEILKNMGFRLKGLTSEQILKLSHNRSKLFKSGGTMAGLELLAESHLPACEFTHGLPYSFTRLNRQRLEQTCLPRRDKRVVWITCLMDQKIDSVVLHTFSENSRLIMPDSIRIHFAYRNEIRAAMPNPQLHSLQLNRRRYPCRILLK